MTSIKKTTVLTPSVIGTTTMPKKTLSYRWIINDAKVFLKNIDATAGFKSPTFSLPLPLREVSRQLVNWHLLIKKGTSSGSFSVSLCRAANGSKSKVLISDCTFSILEFSSNEVKESAIAPTQEVVIGTSTNNIGVSDLITTRHLDDPVLTIQVDAVLLCFTDYIEALETCKVPADNIRDNIKSLHRDPQFADVTITCGGKEFKVHKAILVSQSPVFKRMLAADMTEKRSCTVKITDISPAAVSDLVAYLYTGSAPNVSTQAKELLNAAVKYELPRLLLMCEKELKSRLGAANAIEMFIFAEMHQAMTLKTACLECIKNNFDRVYKSDGWQDLKSKSTNSDDIYSTLVAEMLEFCQHQDLPPAVAW